MSRPCTGQTITILPSLASRAWRGRCGRRSPSTRGPQARYPRPRARLVAEIWRPRVRPESAMKIYTVHVPVLRDGDVSPDPDRVRFVRDGFYFWAFLLGALWMIWNRLWLVLLIYLVGIAALFMGLTALGVSSAAQFVVGLLIAVLIGCEGGSFRRFSLRRRWTSAGVVAATDLEEAE